MFIAHLPAGYLLGKATSRLHNLKTRKLVIWTAIGSVLPDADRIYFHLIDNQSTHHRFYWSHWPVTWLTLLAASIMILRWKPIIGIIPFGLSLGGLLHMILDSVAAPVLWLAPFSNLKIEFVKIPAIYENYIWSFVLHWTFAFEILICSIAVVVFWASRFPGHQKQM